MQFLKSDLILPLLVDNLKLLKSQIKNFDLATGIQVYFLHGSKLIYQNLRRNGRNGLQLNQYVWWKSLGVCLGLSVNGPRITS